MNLQRLREEMLVRYYSNSSNEEESAPNSISLNNYKRLEEKEKKKFERKIVDLTKANRQISHEV